MAEDRVRLLLDKSFAELPVAGDLPRLCNRMQVYVRDGEKSPCITLADAGSEEEIMVVGNEKEQKQKEGKMVYCTDTPKRENLCTLLSVLSSVLEPETKRDLAAEFDAFFPATTEVSSLLVPFLNEKFGGDDSKVVRLIKACNQAIIAPVVTALKTQLGVENMTRDVSKSWITKIYVEEEQIMICTYKREQQLQNLFQYEWELILVFDRKEVKCIDVKVRVTDLMFHETLHTTDIKRKEHVKEVLGHLCTIDDQVMCQSDTKTWEFNPASGHDNSSSKVPTRSISVDRQRQTDTGKESEKREGQVTRYRSSLLFWAENPLLGLFLVSSFLLLGVLILFTM